MFFATVVWWFLSWFEVLVRCYQFFTPDFIQRRVRAAREANANRWASFMVFIHRFLSPPHHIKKPICKEILD